MLPFRKSNVPPLRLYFRRSCLFSYHPRPARRGRQGREKYLGPVLVRGPEIFVKRPGPDPGSRQPWYHPQHCKYYDKAVFRNSVSDFNLCQNALKILILYPFYRHVVSSQQLYLPLTPSSTLSLLNNHLSNLLSLFFCTCLSSSIVLIIFDVVLTKRCEKNSELNWSKMRLCYESDITDCSTNG